MVEGSPRDELFLSPLMVIRNRLGKLAEKSDAAKKFVSNLEIGYTGYPVPNAHAWHNGDTHFIAVSTKLLALMHSALVALMSVPQVFPGLFTKGEEPPDLSIFASSFRIKTLYDQERDGYVLYHVPKSQDRFDMANRCFQLVAEFALWHEVSHCLLNHTRYLDDRFGIAEVGEWEQPSDDLSVKELRRIFEFQADVTATRLMLKYSLPDLSPTAGIRPIDPHFLWSFAVDILFWVMSQDQPLGNEKSTHPHPQMRSFIKYFAVANATFENQDGLSNLARMTLYTSRLATQYWRALALDGSERAWIEPENMSKFSAEGDELDMASQRLYDNSQRGKYVDDALYWELVS
jgi:hypothetical protein